MIGAQTRSVPRVRLAIASLALACTLACGSSSSSSAAPTSPSTTRTTDTFTGTVAIGGSDFHNFQVAATGTVDATLTAVTPSGTVMGLSIGTPADSKCAPLAGASVNATAGSSVQLSGIVSPAALCVAVSDAGNQGGAVSYTVTVVHP